MIEISCTVTIESFHLMTFIGVEIPEAIVPETPVVIKLSVVAFVPACVVV
jgi:hypothetical protein